MWNLTFIIFITMQIFFISSITKTTSNPIETMDIQQIQTPNTIPVAVQVIPSYNKLDEPLIELRQHENTLNGNDGVTVSKNSIIFSELVEPAAVQSSLSTTIVSSKLDDEHIENKIPLIEPIVILEIPTKPESVTYEPLPKPSELIVSPVDTNKQIDSTLAVLLSGLTNTVYGSVIAVNGQGSNCEHNKLNEPLIELQQHENTLNGNDGVTVSKNTVISSELVEPAAVQSSLSTTIVSSKLNDEHNIENKILLIEPLVILEIPTKPESVTNELLAKPSELIISPVDTNKEIDPIVAALLSQLTNTVFGTVIALDGQESHSGHHHNILHGHGNGNSHINSNLISHISTNQNSIDHPIPNQQNVTLKFNENIIIPLLKPIGISTNISEIENLQQSILVLLPDFSKSKQLRKYGNDKFKPIPENHLAHYSHNKGHNSNGEYNNGDDKGGSQQTPDISGLYEYDAVVA